MSRSPLVQVSAPILRGFIASFVRRTTHPLIHAIVRRNKYENLFGGRTIGANRILAREARSEHAHANGLALFGWKDIIIKLLDTQHTSTTLDSYCICWTGLLVEEL